MNHMTHFDFSADLLPTEETVPLKSGERCLWKQSCTMSPPLLTNTSPHPHEGWATRGVTPT